MSFVWCMLSVLNNQSRLLENTRPCKCEWHFGCYWQNLELFVSSVTSILFAFLQRRWSYSTLSDISHFYTAFFFNDHFPNSRCLVQCFISPNKTSLSFLENFIMMVLVIIAVWEDTKNNNGLSKRKQQRISVYLYLTCTFTLSDNKTGITGTGEWKKVLQKSLKL